MRFFRQRSEVDFRQLTSWKRTTSQRASVRDSAKIGNNTLSHKFLMLSLPSGTREEPYRRLKYPTLNVPPSTMNSTSKYANQECWIYQQCKIIEKVMKKANNRDACNALINLAIHGGADPPSSRIARVNL